MYHLMLNKKISFSIILKLVAVASKALCTTVFFALLTASAYASTTVGENPAFSSTTNSAWPNVIVLTLNSDGASSQASQTLSINVTELPPGGANYRIYKTTANGNDFMANPQALVLGDNTITVAAVAFDRSVKVQFSSSDVSFDGLTVNDGQLYPVATTPSGPAAGITLNESSDFYDKDHATWKKVIDLALVADGVTTQSAQTLSINITELPEAGANYRVYKTTANGSDFFGSSVELALGDNIITVAGVTFDRTVKLQFSSSEIRFDELSINGSQLYPEVTVPTDPQTGITAGESPAFNPTSNAAWPRVINLALLDDGASSQAEQTLLIVVTELPEDGANYRVYKTTASGDDFFANPQALTLGENNITVGSVAFDRSVKIQLSSEAVRFDNLSVNGSQLYPVATDPVDPVDPEDPAAGITLNESLAFYDKDHPTWVKVINLALIADGVSTQSAQTLSIHITELPEAGASYRVYKTTANGSESLGSSKELALGDNIITVAGVAFDRTVKLQFSSSEIRFDELSVNGSQLYPEVTVPTDPQTGITAGESPAFNPTSNATWPRVIDLALLSDGASSQAEQTLSIIVTELPDDGANYRVYKTTANGDDFFATPQALTLGENNITVASVAFDRAVKVQLSSIDVRFDSLSVNGNQLYPEQDTQDPDTSDNNATLPEQLVAVKDAPSASLGGSASVTVEYDVSNGEENLTGLGLNIHYDSSVLTFVDSTGVLSVNLIVNDGPYNDDDNADGNALTDKYITANWASISDNSFPGTLPASLITLNFTVAAEVSAETTPIDFSSSSNAAGYAFAPTAYDMPFSSGSWDFDEDGKADALTDGLMLLRYTFNLTGASLTAGAVSSDSALTHAEVEANVAEAASSFADIDGNGEVDALTDGLLLLRYLFNLTGDSLVAGAIGAGAERSSAADVEAYIISLMP